MCDLEDAAAQAEWLLTSTMTKFVTEDSVMQRITVPDETDIDNLVVESSEELVSVIIPLAIIDDWGIGGNVIGMKILTAADAATELSTEALAKTEFIVVSVEMFGLEGRKTVNQCESDKAGKICISMPINASKDLKCTYWIEELSKWSFQGLKTVVNSDGHLQCCTCHLTLFSVLAVLEDQMACSNIGILSLMLALTTIWPLLWMTRPPALLVLSFIFAYFALLLLCYLRDLYLMRKYVEGHPEADDEDDLLRVTRTFEQLQSEWHATVKLPSTSEVGGQSTYAKLASNAVVYIVTESITAALTSNSNLHMNTVRKIVMGQADKVDPSIANMLATEALNNDCGNVLKMRQMAFIDFYRMSLGTRMMAVFEATNPITTLRQFDVYCASFKRVQLIFAYLFGDLMFAAFFFLDSGTANNPRDSDECWEMRYDLTRLLFIGITSVLFVNTILFTANLFMWLAVQRSASNLKRSYIRLGIINRACIAFQIAGFWTITAIFSFFCSIYLLLFTTVIAPVDDWRWVFTAFAAILGRIMVGPLTYSACLSFLVTYAIKCRFPLAKHACQNLSLANLNYVMRPRDKDLAQIQVSAVEVLEMYCTMLGVEGFSPNETKTKHVPLAAIRPSSSPDRDFSIKRRDFMTRTTFRSPGSMGLKVVTHSTDGPFISLVAALCADTLGKRSFEMELCTIQAENGTHELRRQLLMERTIKYWIDMISPQLLLHSEREKRRATPKLRLYTSFDSLFSRGGVSMAGPGSDTQTSVITGRLSKPESGKISEKEVSTCKISKQEVSTCNDAVDTKSGPNDSVSSSQFADILAGSHDICLDVNGDFHMTRKTNHKGSLRPSSNRPSNPTEDTPFSDSVFTRVQKSVFPWAHQLSPFASRAGAVDPKPSRSSRTSQLTEARLPEIHERFEFEPVGVTEFTAVISWLQFIDPRVSHALVKYDETSVLKNEPWEMKAAICREWDLAEHIIRPTRDGNCDATDIYIGLDDLVLRSSAAGSVRNPTSIRDLPLTRMEYAKPKKTTLVDGLNKSGSESDIPTTYDHELDEQMLLEDPRIVRVTI